MLKEKENFFEYNLNSVSYAACDLKYIAKNLVKSKDVSKIGIGFISIILTIISLVIFYLGSHFLGLIIGSILGTLCVSFCYSYLLTKSIDTIKSRKVSPSLKISIKLILLVFISQVLLIGVFGSLCTLIIYIFDKAQKLNFSVRSLIDFETTKFLIISSIIVLILIAILIFIYFIVKKILSLVFYIYASKKFSLKSSISIGFKLGFKNIFRLIGIDFSFIGLLLLSIITLDILLIWKILYIYTSKSILMEKILKDNDII
ncbi:MAG: hypothetical protein ACRCT3_10365 [Aeromonas hydrophila]